MTRTSVVAAAIAVALLSTPSALAESRDAARSAATGLAPAAEQPNVCGADVAATPAPGPPTWWPSSQQLVPAPVEAPESGDDGVGTMLAIGVAASLLAVVAVAGRVRRQRRRGDAAAAVSSPGAS